MALDDDIAILARVPTLSLLERDALRLIAFAAQTRILLAGDVLFRKGDRADGGYVVTAGSIALDARDDGSPAGYVARNGALIGELALIIETTRAATAIAREPSSVMRLSRELMLRVLTEFPEAAVALRNDMLSRVDSMSSELAGVRQRLIAIDKD
jgi:CRP-like cAMP-binding protein